jgi:hypothetical protein
MGLLTRVTRAGLPHSNDIIDGLTVFAYFLGSKPRMGGSLTRLTMLITLRKGKKEGRALMDFTRNC